MQEFSKNEVIAKNMGYYCDKNGNIFNKKHKRMEGTINGVGYRILGLRIEKVKSIKISFHRFIAYEKYGDELFEAECVRHLDGNPLNNLWYNLVIGSHLENILDKPKENMLEYAINASSFIKIHNHKEIIAYRKGGASYKEIMEKFNISSKGTVSFIINKSIDNQV